MDNTTAIFDILNLAARIQKSGWGTGFDSPEFWGYTNRQNNSIKIGLCGQAPSDSPAFASFLVRVGIDSISYKPDTLVKGIRTSNHAEATINQVVDTL